MGNKTNHKFPLQKPHCTIIRQTNLIIYQTNLLNVNCMYAVELRVFMYKFSTNVMPVAVKDYFKTS